MKGIRLSTFATTIIIIMTIFIIGAVDAFAASVSISVYPSGAGTATGSGNYSRNSTVTLNATANTNAGYVFDRWSGGVSSTSNPYSFSMGWSNVSVTANFVKTYTVTTGVSPDGGGSVTGSGTYGSSKSVTLKATPAAGYEFVNWTGNVSGFSSTTSATATFTMGTSDRSVTANFARIYTVSASVSPQSGGSVSGAGSYNSTENVTLTANPASGYVFLNWTGDVSGISNISSSTVTFKMGDANRSITANFAAAYKLTISNPTGISISANPAPTLNGEYAPNTVVELKYTETSTYVFTGWSGSLSGTSNPATLTMNSDKSVSANTTSGRKLVVTINPNSPTESGTVTARGQSLGNGDSINIPNRQDTAISAIPATGYKFVNWTGSSSDSIDNVNSANTTIDGGSSNSNRNIIANFKLAAVKAPTITASPAAAPTNKVTVTIAYPTDSDVPSSGKQYRVNGGDWTRYSSPLVITKNNQLVEARTLDNVGNSSTIASFNIDYLDDILPVLTLTQDPIELTYDDVIITADAQDASGISVLKYLAGSHPVADFATAGTIFTSSFTVTANGTWTVYVKDKAGNEAVSSIVISNISAKPVLTYEKSINGASSPFVFEEAPANDGTIATTRTVLLQNAKFSNTGLVKSGNQLLFEENKHYNCNFSTAIPNLHLYIVRVSDQSALLELRWMKDGKPYIPTAAEHKAATITDLSVTFLDGAFQGVKAASVIGRQKNDMQVRFIDGYKIKILEVYPNAIASGSTEYKNDVSSALTAADAALYEITAISLNKFISMKDDINGNYDILYFGRGTYSSNAVGSTAYGNDITDLAAAKVLDFMNYANPVQTGQLCIFSTDCFVNGTKMNAKFGSLTKDNLKKVVISNTDRSQLLDAIHSFNTDLSINRRPILSVTEKPASYRTLSSPLDSRILRFAYRIDEFLRDTATSGGKEPEDAPYTARLFIDRNSDGLFTGDELFETHTGLNNGKYDSFLYIMPSSLTGVFFWKLEVEDSKHAKSEMIDNVYLRGKEMTINVLQIFPSANLSNINMGDRSVDTSNLSTLINNYVSGTSGDKYSQRTGEYKINITTATVNEFNTPPSADVGRGRFLDNPNGHYDMIIMGFTEPRMNMKDCCEIVLHQDMTLISWLLKLLGIDLEKIYVSDQIDKFNTNAINKLKSFYNTKQSLMFSHYSFYGAGTDELFKSFKDSAAQTDAMSAETFYENNSGSPVNTDYNLAQYYNEISYDNNVNLVRSLNSSALTLYPFNLETYGQNSMIISPSYSQYHKLDLEDGTLVPLFNFYTGVGRLDDDAMNNYYAYSKGNITYSGAGSWSGIVTEGTPDFELMLFVNTMLKAFATSNHAPEIEVIDPSLDAYMSTTVNADNQNLDLSFKAYDFDPGDRHLTYEIYLDAMNNGTYVRITADKDGKPIGSDLNNGDLKSVSFNKGFSNARTFKVRVDIRDDHGAASSAEMTLVNTSDPLINPSIETYDGTGLVKKEGFLVGEEIKIKIPMEVSGKPTTEQTVSPQMNLIVPGGILYNGSDAGATTKPVTNPILFKPDGPYYSGIKITPTAPYPDILLNTMKVTKLNTGNYKFDGNILYSFKNKDNTLINVSKAFNKTINVRTGHIRIRAVDENNNPLNNMEVHLDVGGADMLVLTDDGGYSDYLDLPAGGYAYKSGGSNDNIYTLTIPSDRTFDGLWVNKAGDAIDLSDGNKSADGKFSLSFDNNEWEVTIRLNYTNTPINTIQVKYYKLVASGVSGGVTKYDAQYIGKDTDNGMVIKAKTGKPVKIAALFGIDISGTDVKKVRITAETKDKDGNLITSQISATPVTFDKKSSDIADLDKAVLLVLDNPLLGTGAAYDGKLYYVLIELGSANGQQVRISKMEWHLANNPVTDANDPKYYKVVPQGDKSIRIIDSDKLNLT